MTRQRFFGLRLELCRRIYAMDCNSDKKFNPRSLRDLRPNFDKVGSYAEAWETLKPARDCVGM